MQQITIRKNDFDEYEVPTPSTGLGFNSTEQIYFTPDKQDAIDTCRVHFFKAFKSDISIRISRGHF